MNSVVSIHILMVFGMMPMVELRGCYYVAEKAEIDSQICMDEDGLYADQYDVCVQSGLIETTDIKGYHNQAASHKDFHKVSS